MSASAYIEESSSSSSSQHLSTLEETNDTTNIVENNIRPEWIKYAPYNNIADGTSRVSPALQVPDHYITKYGRKWFERWEQLRAYMARYGDCLVPMVAVEDDKEFIEGSTMIKTSGKATMRLKQLALWVSVQRTQYALRLTGGKSSMTNERIDALESIGFNWRVYNSTSCELKQQKKWNARFRELMAYRRENGNCNVPMRYGHNPRLGYWVYNQRKEFRDYIRDFKESFITEEQIMDLDSIGFDWYAIDLNALAGDNKISRWNQRLNELLAYKNQYGDCDVPTQFDKNPQLGNWVSGLRREYKRRQTGKCRITAEQIQALEKNGFVWSIGAGKISWKQRFEDLCAYRADNGHCNVPRSHGALGNFVVKQRQEYRNSTLTQERVRKLESIGFSWNHNNDQWQEQYADLVEYKRQNGSSNAPQRYRKNPRLGAWVNHQRREYRKFINGQTSQINEERVSQLEAIGFQWSHFVPVPWERRYDDLIAYKAEYGDCNVPRNFKSDPVLARWVNEQRRAYSKFQNKQKSQMNQQRIDALENIGFVWHRRRSSNKTSK